MLSTRGAHRAKHYNAFPWWLQWANLSPITSIGKCMLPTENKASTPITAHSPYYRSQCLKLQVPWFYLTMLPPLTCVASMQLVITFIDLRTKITFICNAQCFTEWWIGGIDQQHGRNGYCTWWISIWKLYLKNLHHAWKPWAEMINWNLMKAKGEIISLIDLLGS